ncbi:bifunctional riboflavin kinase/FAD synthetase [Alkalibacillus aidingensis]|uniref:bifunctional riboflavin kinase/FAD synthetase n=1 Tax=Alkalibacillus aidingensis TaxID=2747607 RepID=UPI0016606E52|nr:bifunctional riboflavin kinase/FAD synthetase [Alkalibacillus aidingensis]
MELLQLSYSQLGRFPQLDELSVAVGYFDGVHKGHQEVIQTAVEEAEKQNIKSGVMTFAPHPLSVIKQQKLSDYLITSLEEKLEIFEELDVDYVIVVTFDQDLAKLSPQTFVDEFFINLNVKHVVGGFDFSFGHKGAGKIQDMRHYSKGAFSFSVVDQVSIGNEKISSTLIRQSLSKGEVSYVENLMGRPFSITAKVKEGFKRGREIGFPTANLNVDSEHKIPKVGIYAVTAEINGEHLYGMASVGFNPTFDDSHHEPVIEVNLFDFNQDIYGEDIKVNFHQYIRDEVKFDNVDELVEKIKEDEKKVKKFFNISR